MSQPLPSWELENTCFQRAVRTALRFGGIFNDDCEWIPTACDSNDIIDELLRRYPVLRVAGRRGPEMIERDNQPTLVIYAVPNAEPHIDGREWQHAVFVSDTHPFDRTWWQSELRLGIMGWDELTNK